VAHPCAETCFWGTARALLGVGGQAGRERPVRRRLADDAEYSGGLARVCYSVSVGIG
jgi:hypothetical protein